MADNLRKFTTQEVLNKVYSDSSGNSIGINAATSKETLNAALDTTNSRLNVSLAGGTIGGDVTINGDLTVVGDGLGAYDEIINGQLEVRGDATDSATGMTGFLTLSTAFTDINATDQLGRINFQAPLEAGGTDAILAGASIYGIAEATFANNNNSTGIAFATATSSVPIERMRIDSSGNVGIGRTPTQKLDIYASSGNQTIMNELGGGGNAELRLKNNAGDRIIRASADKLQFIDNADSRADLTIDGSGNVGIGIASPTSKLSVSAGRGANTGLEILDSADSNNKRIDLRLDADGDGYLSLVDASETTKVQLYSNGVSYFNGGNVGIGTTSPTAKLTVSGSMDDNIIKFGAVPAQNIAFGVTNDRDPTRVDFFLATEYGAESWSKRVTVTNQGNVGIGTTSPDYQLELEKAGGGFLSFKTTDTEIVNNDVLGTIQFGADDATASGIDIGAKIVATATDNFQSASSNVDAPTKLEFFTQDNTTTDVMSTVGATLTLGGDDQNATFAGDITTNERLIFGGTNDSIVASAITPHSNGFIYIAGGSGGLVIGDDATSSRIQIMNDAEIKFEVNGSEKMRIEDSGNINIGSSSSKTNNIGSSARGITIANAIAPVLSLWDTTNAGYHSHFFQVENNATLRSSGNLIFQTNAANTALTIDSSQNSTFAGSINTQDITAYNMITIESADISNGENNGLRLINTSGTDHYWHITNGQTGVSNENFTIRDGTNNRDIVVLETSSGNATFYNRIILGGGITFPASQNASSNANTLDDYEEGTWTPVYYNITDGANVTATYDDTRYGFYTKIGRVVTLSCYMRTDALTAPDATDLIGIGGLPFTVSASSDGHPLYPTSRFLITASDWSDAPQTISVGENEAFARLNAEVSANIETDTGVHTLGNDFTAGTTANRNAIAFSITYQV